jgi:hypothetical protein
MKGHAAGPLHSLGPGPRNPVLRSAIVTEDQEAVFEEFRQVGKADKEAEGTGLGLAFMLEVCRTALWSDLGEEPDRRRVD